MTNAELDPPLSAEHLRSIAAGMLGDDDHAPATDDGKVAASTRLVRIAEAGYTFATTPEGEPFAIPLSGPTVVRVLRGTDSLRAELAETFYALTGKAPAQQALTDAVAVLEGRARRGARQPLALRVAHTDEALWLDLGDDTGRAVSITRNGWTTRTSPVLFRRTALTGALPDPVPGGDLSELWQLLNVSAADRPIVAAVLVAALLPDVSHPVVLLTGEQGSGKSSASRLLAGLLDPSPAQLRKSPRDVEAWTTAAAGSWVVAVDNLSTLPDWFSDALCRAATGDGDVRRKLYSDGDLHVVAFRRCVLLNGIDLGAVRDDLADRLVTVALERIPDTKRRYDADLAERWADAHPRILGAVLDLAVRVLVALDDLRLPDPPRMADFGRVLAAVDVVLGTDGLARYRAQAGDLAADAVSTDPVLTGIADSINLTWEGTAAELLDLITPDRDGWRPGRDWPKNARALTGTLRRRAPSLRRLGWVVEDLGRQGKANAVRFQLSPPKASDEASDEAATSVTLAVAAPVARRSAPFLTCDDAETASEASDASDGCHRSSPKGQQKEKEGPDAHHIRESLETSLASLASPPRLAHLPGRCHCGFHVQTQGHRPDCRHRRAAS